MAEMTESELRHSIEEQNEILTRALLVYGARNRKYQDLWKKYGAKDQLLHIRSKFLRMKQGLETQATDEEIVEDALDLINYAAMVIRNVEDGNRGHQSQTEVVIPLTLLEDMAGTEGCMLDHEDNCQVHAWFGSGRCPFGQAQDILEER
jgi:hypothetical protein